LVALELSINGDIDCESVPSFSHEEALVCSAHVDAPQYGHSLDTQSFEMLRLAVPVMTTRAKRFRAPGV